MLDREQLGRIVRETWVNYCHEIGDEKPSHIAPWEELSESDREVDRRIGEAIVKAFQDEIAKSISELNFLLDTRPITSSDYPADNFFDAPELTIPKHKKE